MGYLTQSDSTLYRGFFKEMAYLRGIPVKYQYIVYSDPTIHAEFISQFSEPEDMDIIFEENPKPSTLKKLGWISEYTDDKPFIAYLPFDAKELSRGARLTIPPIDNLQNEGRLFEVTDISNLLEYPDAWICKLAPVIDSKSPKLDYEDTNFNYVMDDQPSVRGRTPHDTNFSYITVDD